MIQERKGLLLAGLALSLAGMLVGTGVNAEVGYGGGGGGGGGADPNCFLALQAPAGGFSVQVSGGARTTTSNVQLTLNGGAATRMAISNDPSFDGVSSESYQTSRSWTLPAGLGSKTIYVRFYNSCGISSSVFSTTIEVIAPTTPDTGSNSDSNNNGGEVLGEKINASIDDLIARLRYGQRNEDVLALQQALAAVGLMPRGWHATNYYGPVTLAAVTRYVDSHAGNLDELIGRLRYGTTHPDVRRLQRLLVSRNLMPRGWRISSYYGTATRSAVARYQASR